MFNFGKNAVEVLVSKRQKLILQKEKLQDANNVVQASLDTSIEKLRNKKNHLDKNCNDKVKRLDLQIDKIGKQITVEKAFISGIDKD